MILSGETFILEQYGPGSKSVSNIDGAKGFYVQFAVKSSNDTQLLHANLIIPNIAYTYNSLIMRASTLKITNSQITISLQYGGDQYSSFWTPLF